MTFIKSIQSNPKGVLLKEYGPPVPELLITNLDTVNVVFLDTETTGVDRENDKIIEIAIKLVKFEGQTGKIIAIDKAFESFNDPDENIATEITQLTGITNEMVANHQIAWDIVDAILKNSDLIVAHNAGFDRAFIDCYSTVSPNKMWGCSINDIDWLGRGFASPKQELLCHWHGFYFEAHRAMNDVDALIHLVTHDFYKNDRPILELIENSKKPEYVIFAENFQYDPIKKDIVKAHKYKWNPKEKIWYKRVLIDDLEREKAWLTNAIYDNVFKGRIEEINLTDKYKL